jgi:hypothetical protein
MVMRRLWYVPGLISDTPLHQNHYNSIRSFEIEYSKYSLLTHRTIGIACLLENNPELCLAPVREHITFYELRSSCMNSELEVIGQIRIIDLHIELNGLRNFKY